MLSQDEKGRDSRISMLPKQLINGALRAFGYEIQRSRPSTPPVDVPLVDVFDLVLGDYLRHNPEPFLVQVGAHDGKTDDPAAHLIRRHRLHALLIEPQPIAFRRLVENHGNDPRILFERSLIGSHDGSAKFYKVREDMPGLPPFLLQSASMDRTRVERALGWYRDANPHLAGHEQDLQDLIEEEDVPSLTWRSLLEKHRLNHIDILLLDTMGFDYELLKTFPFELTKPDIIHYEHALLSPEDQMASVALLASHGYSMAKVAVDTIAVRKAKTRHWMFHGWAA